MRDRLFTNQRAMSPKDLTAHAGSLGLDLPEFQRCLDSDKYAAKIRKDLVDGQKAGVQGTPAFFLALAGPNEATVKAVRMIRGAQPYAVLKAAIDSLLAR